MRRPSLSLPAAAACLPLGVVACACALLHLRPLWCSRDGPPRLLAPHMTVEKAVKSITLSNADIGKASGGRRPMPFSPRLPGALILFQCPSHRSSGAEATSSARSANSQAHRWTSNASTRLALPMSTGRSIFPAMRIKSIRPINLSGERTLIRATH